MTPPTLSNERQGESVKVTFAGSIYSDTQRKGYTMSSEKEMDRRSFVKTTAGSSLALGLTGLACKTTGGKVAPFGAQKMRSPNDKIQIGVIGIGGRGSYLLKKGG